MFRRFRLRRKLARLTKLLMSVPRDSQPYFNVESRWLETHRKLTIIEDR